MSPDPSSAAWHEALAEHDAEAHDRMAELADTDEVQALRRRLEALNAELQVMRAGLDTRNRLLQEQAVALAERDARLATLQGRGAGAAVMRLARLVLANPRLVLGRIRRRLHR